ncbi:MAG: site-2 protease family protein [Candidatus Methanoperedens sp.]|nr:site-2 protease family protein [Candidatus Methanoperedens sp.]CAG0975397.1 Regulator of sigma-E protease RseP [Methanosarcinales archaeon]
MNYTDLLLPLFLFYWLIVMILNRRGTLAKHNITAWGPILMIRTTKGQEFLDRLAVHKRFWRTFANIGLPAMLIGMLMMFLLIVFIDYSLINSFQTQTVPQPTKFNEPRNIFLIPGLNEFIPLIWGAIALIVTLMVHEFSHAILCKVEGIKVKSMGILLALVPVGGFAEPDEEQLLGKKEERTDIEETEGTEEPPKRLATRAERVRVLTAGVMANFVTAVIAFVLFFLLLGSISTVGEVMITTVVPGSPADLAGVNQSMILTGINDNKINNASDFLFLANTITYGSNIKLNLVENGVQKEIHLAATGKNVTHAGVNVSQVTEGSAAEAAGIKAGMIIVRIDDTQIKELKDFITFMNSTKEGQKIDVYLLSSSSLNASTQVFKAIELRKNPSPMNANKGFLGVSYSPEAVIYSLGIGIGEFPAKTYLHMLKSIPSLMTGITGWVIIFGLPIYGFGGEGFPGFSGILMNFYEPTGWVAVFGVVVFWVLNALLWIGWMNLYAGLFNCLPAVPLDGGHVFRDVMASFLTKVFGDGEKVERISNAIVLVFALLILLSFVFVMIAPFAAHGF